MDHLKLIHGDLLIDAPLLAPGKLEGAAEAPFATWEGHGDLVPALTEKAAKLVEALVTAHAYMDGNKRLAWQAMVVFLELNGRTLRDMPAIEAAGAIYAIEAHRLTRQQLALWIDERLVGLV